MSVISYDDLHRNLVCALLTRKQDKQPLPTAAELGKTLAGDIPLANLGLVVSMVCADYVQGDKHWDRALRDALLWKESLSNSLYRREVKKLNFDVWNLADEVL